MGQKTHPIGFRIGTQYGWKSTWFSNRNYADLLEEDLKIRGFLKEKLDRAGLEKVEIERSTNKLKVLVYVSRPGMVIGRSGSGIDEIRKELEKISGSKIQIAVSEVKESNLSASLVAQNVVRQIEKRIPAKRAMASTLERVMTAGAKGAKIAVKGRIGGQEIARNVHVSEGSVPLHTLDSEIDFATKTAHTKYGTIGVKAWINLGKKVVSKNKKQAKKKLENRHKNIPGEEISPVGD